MSHSAFALPLPKRSLPYSQSGQHNLQLSPRVDAQMGLHGEYHPLQIQPAPDFDQPTPPVVQRRASPMRTRPSPRQTHFLQYLFSSLLLSRVPSLRLGLKRESVESPAKQSQI